MSFYRYYIPNLANQFHFKTISMHQLRNTIKSIKKTTSTDYYGISMNILNNLMKSIEPILLNIVNIAIETGNFPSNLNISKILPIPKKMI